MATRKNLESSSSCFVAGSSSKLKSNQPRAWTVTFFRRARPMSRHHKRRPHHDVPTVQSQIFGASPQIQNFPSQYYIHVPNLPQILFIKKGVSLCFAPPESGPYCEPVSSSLQFYQRIKIKIKMQFNMM